MSSYYGALIVRSEQLAGSSSVALIRSYILQRIEKQKASAKLCEQTSKVLRQIGPVCDGHYYAGLYSVKIKLNLERNNHKYYENILWSNTLHTTSKNPLVVITQMIASLLPLLREFLGEQRSILIYKVYALMTVPGCSCQPLYRFFDSDSNIVRAIVGIALQDVTLPMGSLLLLPRTHTLGVDPCKSTIDLYQSTTTGETAVIPLVLRASTAEY